MSELLTETLPVRLSGQLIGELRPSGAFTWRNGWEGIASLNAPVLSHSLPFGAEGCDPGPFFGGLLPEGAGLDSLAREARVASNDLYGLLAEVGADVGGAVTIGEPRPPLPPIPLESEQFAGVLERAFGYYRGASVGGGGSAATGVQRKISLTRDGVSGTWLIGRGSTPSTHILKPVPREYTARIQAEVRLNRIAQQIGLSNHEAWVERAGERDVLIVERYDRSRTERGDIVRLHQEDAAQALGLPWGGNGKYESVNPRASPDPLAMRIAGKSQAAEVEIGDLVEEAAGWGVSRTRAETAVQGVLAAIRRALQAEAVAEAHATTTQQALIDFLGEQVDNLLRGDQAWTRSLPAALVHGRLS